MSGCGCGCAHDSGAGPFSKGRELVEFVCQAHGGAVKDQPIRQGPIETLCQGCNKPFVLETYVGVCEECGGVHAMAPMFNTADQIQFAGEGFTLPA